MSDDRAAGELADVVMRGLAAGRSVEIDGLGVFHPDRRTGFRFEPRTLPRAFIAYVREDLAAAERLFASLEAAGFAPWMDTARLIPGQNWPRAIEAAIESSDFFLACFSGNSVNKRGGFQAEIRYALDCARRTPLDAVFIVPLRLDACRVPRPIQRETQYIDLFPDWEQGIGKLTAALKSEIDRRRPPS